MEGVNANVHLPQTQEFVDDGVPLSSSKVEFYLNNLLALHSSNPDLTPQQLAEASIASAAAAAIAAKAARAIADEKAAAAAKAVAAAKNALDLIASFRRTDHVAADLIPLGLPLGDIVPNSCLNVVENNGQCEVPISAGEGINTVDAVAKRVDFSDLGMVLDSDRPGGEEGIQATRKRGRPKSK